MLDNPWNAPIRTNADDPSPRVVSLHRGAVVPLAPYRAARATRDAGMLAALAERAEEAAYDDFVRADGLTRLGTPADPFARLNRQVGTMSDPALGGTTGIVILTMVAAFIGAMLACGGVL